MRFGANSSRGARTAVRAARQAAIDAAHASSLKNPRPEGLRLVDWDDKFAPRLPPAFEHGQVAAAVRSVSPMRHKMPQLRLGQLDRARGQASPFQPIPSSARLSNGRRSHGSSSHRSSMRSTRKQQLSSSAALRMLLGQSADGEGDVPPRDWRSTTPRDRGDTDTPDSLHHGTGSRGPHEFAFDGSAMKLSSRSTSPVSDTKLAAQGSLVLPSADSARSESSSPGVSEGASALVVQRMPSNLSQEAEPTIEGNSSRPLKALMPKDFAARAMEESARSQFRHRQVSKKRHASIIRPESAHAIAAEGKYVIATGLRDAEAGFDATAAMGPEEQGRAMVVPSARAQRVFSDRMQAWETAGSSCSSVVVR